MLRQLFPKDYIRSIFDLNIMELKKNKIRGLIFDIDNTLVPFDVAHPNQKLIRFFLKN